MRPRTDNQTNSSSWCRDATTHQHKCHFDNSTFVTRASFYQTHGRCLGAWLSIAFRNSFLEESPCPRVVLLITATCFTMPVSIMARQGSRLDPSVWISGGCHRINSPFCVKASCLERAGQKPASIERCTSAEWIEMKNTVDEQSPGDEAGMQLGSTCQDRKTIELDHPGNRTGMRRWRSLQD